MVEIQPIGTVLRANDDGFLESGLTETNIKPPWREPVELMRQTYLDILGDKLHSIYIRGSVARGTAVEGVSDIDSVAVVDAPIDVVARYQPILAEHARQFERQFPVSIFIELQAKPLDPILSGKNRIFRVLAHCSSICVYGQDLSKMLPPVKPDPEAVVVAYDFDRVLQESVQRFGSMNSDLKPWHCRRVMKFLLRTGFEIVMEREQAWTRDLYPCYQLFSKHCPEREPQMYRVLELALNPIIDRERVMPVLEELGPWMVKQIDAQLRQ